MKWLSSSESRINRTLAFVIAIMVVALFVAATPASAGQGWYQKDNSLQWSLYLGFWTIALNDDWNAPRFGTIDRIVADEHGTDWFVILLHEPLPDGGGEIVTIPERLQQPNGLEPGVTVLYNPLLPADECTREEFNADSTYCWESLLGVWST